MLQNRKYFLLLHVLLIIYSLTGIFGKKAAAQTILSSDFLLYYVSILMILTVYAFGWQQIIKVLPLSTAFANKSVTVIWGFVWGKVLFGENITLGKLVGIICIVVGIILFSYSGKSLANER